jgi:autotransporter-associated beta strand protein
MKTKTLLIRCALFSSSLLFISFFGYGQTTSDWLNTAPDGNWKQGAGGARWSGGQWDEPPYGIIRFNNNHQLSMTNNVVGPYNQFQIIFGSSNTSSRTINGSNINSVRFSDFSGSWPRIDNQSEATHTIGFPIIVNSGGSWNLELATNNASTGQLIFNSNATISNNTSKILFIYGNGTTNSNRTVALNGVISGNGSLRIKLGGIARIGINHTFSGSTTIEEGELWIDNGGDISASSINLGDGSVLDKTSKLHISDIDGGTIFIRNVIVNEGQVGRRFIGGFNTTGINTFSGNIDRSGQGSFQLNLESTSLNGTVEFSGDINGNGPINVVGSGTIQLTGANTYTGSTTINAGTLQLNKTGGGTLPNTNSITVSNGGTLRISSNQTLADLTINSGGTVIVDANVQLTINGILSNSGTLTLENGATLVQGSSSTLAGTNGVYNVNQTITGAGTTTPTGRFWYLGSPVASASSAVFYASNAANVVRKRDEGGADWDPVAPPENLEVGRGYYIQAIPTNPTITFTGGNINHGDITTQNLTSSGSTYTGFNLVSNPYPSYLDWVSITKTNVGGTMWYRTHDGANMDFGTVNASGFGTTVNGSVVLTRYIPPMQSFWVRVSTFGQAASLTFNNSGRSHFISQNSSVAGLKSGNVSPSLFVRMNLKQGQKSDQLIIYTDELSSNGLDINDAEKMMQATNPQFYTKVGTQKTVINALNPSKKQQSLPITLELPTTGVHSFVIEDLEISNGLVWLEDKQEEIMQALEPGTVYEFYANSGINAARFVLHFQLIDNTTPFNVYNEVNSSANFSGKGASVHAESAGVLVIKLPATTEGITDIQIRDAAGKLVYTGATNTLETSVQLEQANGIYYVTLNSASGVEVRKVFIQQ